MVGINRKELTEMATNWKSPSLKPAADKHSSNQEQEDVSN